MNKIVPTPQGDVTLLPPPVEILWEIRRWMPFGAARYRPAQQNADYGIVMQCGDREVFFVKQQPSDCDEKQRFTTFSATVY